MLAELLRTQVSAITFDLGAAGLRAWQLRRRGRTDQGCDSLRIERMTGDLDDPVPPPTVAAEQFARLIGQGRFVGRDVALVLSPPEVQFYPLRLPEQALSQPIERLEQALRWEINQESRGATDDLEIRHWRLPSGRGQPANVMAVALRTQLALDWHRQLADEGLALTGLDVAPCALVRLCRCVWDPAEEDLWGVLDIGLRHTTLTLAVGGTPVYIRTLNASAHQWTRHLARAFEVSYAEADQLKRDYPITPTQDGVRTAPAGANLLDTGDIGTALSRALRDPLQTLARDVGRCYSYLMQSFPEHTARQLFLAGGGARLAGLPAVLQAELGIPVSLLASPGPQGLPWQHPLADVQVEPGSAAALGGALLNLEGP